MLTLQLRLLPHGPNLQPLAILLEDPLVVVLPELLGGVLARDALEDLGAAGVLVDEVCRTSVRLPR
jgi:hypothetical protein